jgi:hypothetical protein
MNLGFLGFGKIATHHANVFQHLGCKITAIQSRKIPGNAFESKVDAIIVALLPEILPEYIEKVIQDPRPCLIEKMPPVEAPSNKVAAYNRRFYSTVSILRERVRQGGLVHYDADLPPSGAQMHGFDLMLHLFGDIRAVTVKGPLNTSIRAIFDDNSCWTLKPFETLSVVKGGDVQGTEMDPIRKYTFPEVNRWTEDATWKPGFLEQAKSFIEGVRTGNFGLCCTAEENKKRYEILNSLAGTKPPQASTFTVRKV